MSDLVLDEEALADAQRIWLIDCLAMLRVATDRLLDELRVADPARRAAMHAQAIEKTTPILVGIAAKDADAFRRGGPPPDAQTLQ